MRASIRDEVLAELRGGNGPSSISNVPTSSSVHRPNLDLDLDEIFSCEFTYNSRPLTPASLDPPHSALTFSSHTLNMIHCRRLQRRHPLSDLSRRFLPAGTSAPSS
ncbi:hypothetical protein LguiA_001534 [Lonicera macranthoides]